MQGAPTALQTARQAQGRRHGIFAIDQGVVPPSLGFAAVSPTTGIGEPMDYELGRSTRKCAKTGRELTAGEVFYSVLTAEGSQLARHDYAAEVWEGAPAKALGWWKSQTPAADAKNKKPHWAPNDVMLQLFDELAEQPHRADMRYVLALLLLRRRVLRMEDTEQAGLDGESLLVYCARRQAEYKVPVIVPDGARAEEIQQDLARLLLSDAP
jgi:hypothetical protein